MLKSTHGMPFFFLSFLLSHAALKRCCTYFNVYFSLPCPLPLVETQRRSIFEPHIPHQYFTPSVLSGRQSRFYLCSTTHQWRPGWLQSHWDNISCVWCYKRTAIASWLQAILWPFVWSKIINFLSFFCIHFTISHSYGRTVVHLLLNPDSKPNLSS